MEAIEQVYADFLQSPAGGAIVADLDREFGGNPFCADNPHTTSYRCGQLSVVSHILNHVPQIRQEKANVQSNENT